MTLADYVHTFGQAMRVRYGERVHKIATFASGRKRIRVSSFRWR